MKAVKVRDAHSQILLQKDQFYQNL